MTNDYVCVGSQVVWQRAFNPYTVGSNPIRRTPGVSPNGMAADS